MTAPDTCPFCDPESKTLSHALRETEQFFVLCDPYPLTEGHILIIPKQHTPCMGALSPDAFREFVILFEDAKNFLMKTYGKCIAFEHGNIGQSVLHANLHLLPCDTAVTTLVPEGEANLESLQDVPKMRNLFAQRNQYLFLAIQDKMWAVNSDLAKPRFFRDRLAVALGKGRRANWKAVSSNKAAMAEIAKEISTVEEAWKKMQH